MADGCSEQQASINYLTIWVKNNNAETNKIRNAKNTMQLWACQTLHNSQSLKNVHVLNESPQGEHKMAPTQYVKKKQQKTLQCSAFLAGTGLHHDERCFIPCMLPSYNVKKKQIEHFLVKRWQSKNFRSFCGNSYEIWFVKGLYIEKEKKTTSQSPPDKPHFDSGHQLSGIRTTCPNWQGNVGHPRFPARQLHIPHSRRVFTCPTPLSANKLI